MKAKGIDCNPKDVVQKRPNLVSKGATGKSINKRASVILLLKSPKDSRSRHNAYLTGVYSSWKSLKLQHICTVTQAGRMLQAQAHSSPYKSIMIVINFPSGVTKF